MSFLFRNNVNWAHKAKLARRKFLNRDDVATTICDAKKVAQELQGADRTRLQEHTDRLRSFARVHRTKDHARLLSLACGAVIEAVRRHMNVDMFDVQLHAGVVVSAGAAAEMQTGEGKTLALVIPAYFQALAGRGVHVVTPNAYLAKRDFHALHPVFDWLGMSTGLILDEASHAAKRDAYGAEVTYGPGYAFGFDFLRDQLTLEQMDSAKLGHHVYSRLKKHPPRQRLLQRGLAVAIIDEIDHVLIDDAVSPLVLAESSAGCQAADAEVHVAACRYAMELEPGQDYQQSGKVVSLTDRGYEKVYRLRRMTVHRELVRPWHEYVLLALRAKHDFHRDVHYVVHDRCVRVVDSSTGRIFEGRQWSDGLHQAIEAKEGLSVSGESVALAKITRQHFYRNYDFVGGVTGTAVGCERELASTYGLPVKKIPPRFGSRRSLLPLKVTLNQASKLAAIADETLDCHLRGRAVLIGTLSIQESMAVSAKLHEKGIKHALLNGLQDVNEAEIISAAGRRGAITVATNMAGRGTDIQLDQEVAMSGGLHVIVTQMHTLCRVDRQLIGRCARCGDPGSARIYVSAEDALCSIHAPWVGRAIARQRKGDTVAFLERHLAKAQRTQEKAGATSRSLLLQADVQYEQLMSKSISPVSCSRLVG